MIPEKCIKCGSKEIRFIQQSDLSVAYICYCCKEETKHEFWVIKDIKVDIEIKFGSSD